MQNTLDEFIEIRQKQLESVASAYKHLKDCLNELPESVASEVERMLWQEMANKFAVPTEPARNDLAGLTALECVSTILQENGNRPMHFSTIAKEALRRGYKGRIDGTQDEIESTTAKSFWAAMSRSEELEPTGKGMYRLRAVTEVAHDSAQEAAPGSIMERPTRRRMTQGDAAEEAIEAAGHSLRMSEILAYIEEHQLLEVPTGKIAQRSFSNAVWSAMDRDTNRFVKADRGLWGLVKWGRSNLEDMAE